MKNGSWIIQNLIWKTDTMLNIYNTEDLIQVVSYKNNEWAKEQNQEVQAIQRFVAEGRCFHPYGCRNKEQEAILHVARSSSSCTPRGAPSYLKLLQRGCHLEQSWYNGGPTAVTGMSQMGSATWQCWFAKWALRG